ncbi:hypothetical protein D1007_47044 [Hordeum vulgare]|nr:hypothetical protein D1007_47044 [Hordeum vulgare]
MRGDWGGDLDFGSAAYGHGSPDSIGGTSRSGVCGLDGDRLPRPGGRFWILADTDDEEEAHDSKIISPMPSDGICSAFQDGLSEDEVGQLVDVLVPSSDPARLGLKNENMIEIARRVARRRTMDSSRRPWHGPLLKVSLPKLTLADFMPWKVVTYKKKQRNPVLPAVMRRPVSQIASASLNVGIGPLDLPSEKTNSNGMIYLILGIWPTYKSKPTLIA